LKTRLLILILFLAAGCTTTEPFKGLLGAYHLDDGRTISIRRSAENSLRYRIYETGASGRLYRDNGDTYVSGEGFTQRDPVHLVVHFETDEYGVARELDWRKQGDRPLRATRIGKEREFWFESDGVQLFGRLHLPATPPPWPAVVLIHGSGDSPGTEWLFNSDFFVANGIAALTYDKRGSGNSGGTFTFDFHQLARDANSAVDFLKTLEHLRFDQVGLSGYSQGAWVAPLAASENDSVGFVIVNYGMINSPAEEARLEMRQILVDAGVDGQQLLDADEVIRAAVDLVATGLEGDWSHFEALRKKHRQAPWKHYLDGTPVGKLLLFPRFLVKLIGKRQLPPGLPWYYDSSELMESSDIPMVWLLAGQDRSAPGEQTIEKLRQLAQAGKPYQLRVFPGADHSMLTFELEDGERIYKGYAPGYFQAEVEAVFRLAKEQEVSVQ